MQHTRVVLVAPGMAPSLLDYLDKAPVGIKGNLLVATHPGDRKCPTAATLANSAEQPLELTLVHAPGSADRYLFDYSKHGTDLLLPLLLTGLHPRILEIGTHVSRDLLVKRAAGLVAAVLALPAWHPH